MKNKKILIILGDGLNPDNSLSINTKIRCDESLDLQDKFDLILCSSQRTYKEKLNSHTQTEAQAMKNYLVKNNVDSSKIILEESSKDTFSNAYFSRLIVEKFNINDLYILTSNFHVKKTKFLFKFVFNKTRFNLKFISCKDAFLDFTNEKKRKISEKFLINFYKTHLTRVYNLKKGDLNSIGYFIENVNPAMTGRKDKYHIILTNKVEAKLSVYNIQ